MSGCLHHLVEAWADRTPDALAVRAPGRDLTYRELDRAADRVAARLAAAGVRAGGLVTVFGRPTPELLAGLLGTLKAGAAWLPLEPGDPQARTRALLGVAAPDAVLCPPEWADAWAGRAAADTPVVPLDGAVLSGPAERVLVPAGPDSVAYVLFTSGSTGVPKAVQVEHRSLVAYCRWVARTNATGGSVAPLPAVTRFTSDASMQQLVAPLVRGDAVWLVAEETRTDPERLLAELAARPGAGLHCVPALWEELLLLLEGSGARRPELAALFLGGDRVREDLWDRTRRLLPRTALANVYGPTEATVQVTGGFQPPHAPLTVGRPAGHARVSVRDGQGRPVPAGTEGEVHIGGICLARGYLGRPDLTAERFAMIGGERLYRTGDVGTLLPDGTLRLLGRLDDQVKIRGHRVEPGEVEAALAGLPGVRRAAVAVRTDAAGAAWLAAGVELTPPLPGQGAAGGDGTPAKELLAGLARRLPAHFVPATLRIYDPLPVTPNGKFDRVRIAADAAAPPADAGSGPQAFRTPLEERVAAVWTALLARPATSPDDDFFELGGHSLLAVRVAGRLRRELGLPVGVAHLFEHRTVGTLAQALGELAATDDAGTPDDQAWPDTAPLSVQQEALWATEQLLAGTPFNTTLLPVMITGPLDVPVLTAALGDVVAAHPALRSRVVRGQDGSATQTVVPPGPVPVPGVDLSGGPAGGTQAAVREARALLAQSLDPVAGPVLRARLLRLDEGRRCLLLALHHLFCDGVSLPVVVEDLAAAYGARLGGEVPAGSVTGYPHLRHAQRQRADLAAGRYDADLAYWTAKLGRRAERFTLGPEPDGDADPFRFVSAAEPLGAGLAQRLGAFARTQGATPFMCVTAAVAAVLHARGAASPVRLGTLTANRDDPELDRAVGLFAGTLVLDVTVDPRAGFTALVAAARAEVLASFARQRVPLESALEALSVREAPFRIGVAWEPPKEPVSVGLTRFEVFRPAGEAPPAVLPSSTDASFVVREQGADLLLSLEVRSTVLDQEQAGLLLREIRDLLGAFLQAPDRPVAELSGARR